MPTVGSVFCFLVFFLIGLVLWSPLVGWLGWVGLGWVGLGWVGLGWVGLGWVGLGWLVGPRHHQPHLALGPLVGSDFVAAGSC